MKLMNLTLCAIAITSLNYPQLSLAQPIDTLNSPGKLVYLFKFQRDQTYRSAKVLKEKYSKSPKAYKQGAESYDLVKNKFNALNKAIRTDLLGKKDVDSVAKSFKSEVEDALLASQNFEDYVKNGSTKAGVVVALGELAKWIPIIKDVMEYFPRPKPSEKEELIKQLEELEFSRIEIAQMR